jgi:hypothetical protein
MVELHPDVHRREILSLVEVRQHSCPRRAVGRRDGQHRGDASIEWFTVTADGSKVLVNDTANGGVAAFQVGTVPSPGKEVKVTIKTAANGALSIKWPSGVLQSADTLSGSYQNVPQARP